MAATDSIRTNLRNLENELVESTNIVACLTAATANISSPDTPPWVDLISRLINRIDNAAQQVMEDMNLECLPLLRDMESVTKKS